MSTPILTDTFKVAIQSQPITFNGFDYLISPTGIYFRRAGSEVWTQATNFGLELIDLGEVVRDKPYATARLTFDGTTKEQRIPLSRLQDCQSLATEMFGSQAVVFVVRGNHRHIRTAVLVHWLHPGLISREDTNPKVSGRENIQNDPDRPGETYDDGDWMICCSSCGVRHGRWPAYLGSPQKGLVAQELYCRKCRTRARPILREPPPCKVVKTAA